MSTNERAELFESQDALDYLYRVATGRYPTLAQTPRDKRDAIEKALNKGAYEAPPADQRGLFDGGVQS
jgi:hypothetical protein